MSFPINPISDIVVVAPTLEASAIELISPRASWRGRVLAAGPEATEVKVNDVVRLEPGRSIESIFDQKRVWVTRESAILAVEDA